MILTLRPSCLFALTLLSLAATSLSAATTVYKVKNPDGSISYSDQPQDNAEVMQVEPVPTVPAVPVDRSLYDSKPAEDVATGNAYKSFAITSPVNDEAFHSPEGVVEIRVALEPVLKDSHTLEYWLDGALHQRTQAPAVQLNNVDRGTHTVQVKILDGTGKVIENRSSTFTIHRPIARPNQTNPNPARPNQARP